MLLVFGFIALTIMVLSGFGAALSGDRQTSDRSFFDLAILGLLLVSAIGLIANFFVPLRLSLVVATAVVGIACFVLHRRLLWASLGQRPLAMLAVLAAILAMDSLGVLITPLSYDTGLYHLQLIEWLEQAPKVFGLVNLHYRFGVNSIWFVDASMFDVIRDTHAGIFLLNTTLFTIVIGALIQPVLSGAASDSLPRISDLFAVIVAAALLVNPTTIMFNQLFASPGNDLPGALLLVYAFWAFLRIFEADRDKEAWLLQLFVAGVLAVMTKIATAPGLLLLPIAGYAVFARDLRRVWGLARDPILLCLVTVGAAWMATGIISSGCIAFPAGSTCIAALPWTPPIGDIADFATLVTAWARLPNAHVWEAAHGWAWLKDWPSMMLARRDFHPRHELELSPGRRHRGRPGPGRARRPEIPAAGSQLRAGPLRHRLRDRDRLPGQSLLVPRGARSSLRHRLSARLAGARHRRRHAGAGDRRRRHPPRRQSHHADGIRLRLRRPLPAASADRGLEGGGVMAVDSRCPGLPI